MRELGPVTAQEMVDAFLKAERDSPRFSTDLLMAAARRSITADILFDETYAEERIQILGDYRGYRRNESLFTGFPDDVEWRRVQLDAGGLTALRYARHDAWIKLSDGSRRVLDGAALLDVIPVQGLRGSINEGVRAVVSGIKAGAVYPELIAVEETAGRLVLLEGHTRATAHAYTNADHPLDLIVGRSPGMNAWRYL